MKQFTDNIPVELRSLPRWIPVGMNDNPKCPACKDWQRAASQKKYDSITGNVGFVCSVHHDDSFDTSREDYLLLDFDHVRDSDGNFVNEDAEKCFNFVLDKLSAEGNVFCEYSMSGTGFHILACPTPRKYNFAAQDAGTVWFGKHDTKDEKKNCPKLEIFVGSQGRQVVLTGNLYRCDKTAKIPRGKVVDDLLDTLAQKISTQGTQGGLDFDAVPVPSTELVTAFATAPPADRTHVSAPKFRCSTSKQELEILKNAVRIIAPDYVAVKLNIVSAKKGYVCPHCGNGSGPDGTGIVPSYLTDHFEWHCYKCQNSYDNIAIAAQYLGLSLQSRDFVDTVNKIANMFGIGFTPEGEFVSPHFLKNFTPPAKKDAPVKDYTNFYNNVARPNLPKFLAQCGGSWRGFTAETLEHFHCGYTDAFKPADTPAVIIPYSANHFFARFVGDKDKLTVEQKNLLREKYHTVGSKPVFNAKLALGNDNPVCFVVESATDAMSIYQASGYNVIAVSGSSLSAVMREQLKPYTGKKFIVMLDGDATGQRKKQELADQLTTLGHQAVAINLSDSYKDANDFLQADADGLAARLTAIYESAVQFFAKMRPAAATPVVTPAQVPAAVEEWQSFNGAISPDVLPRLITAKKYLDALEPKDITPGVAQSSKAKHSVALCKVYDCYADAADAFFAKLTAAKRTADAEIKKCEFQHIDPPVELVAVKNIGVAEIKDAVQSLVKTYTKAHKEFVKAEEQRKVREEVQHKFDAAQTQRSDDIERLKTLAKQDACPERDAAIVDTIKQLCTWKYDKRGNPVEIAPRQENADYFFKYDPALEGLFAYDAFQDADVFLKAPPWNSEVKKGDQWSDNDDRQLRVYLRRKYAEFDKESLVYDTVTDFANQRRFNVVKDYFKSLPAWDGTPRAETFFIDWNKVPDTPYARAVTMNWLLGATARIFWPGCEYQSVIVLQGAQGTGKDFNLKRLAAGWHAAITDNLDSGDAVDVLKLAWIAVLEEMYAVTKSHVNAVKSFISRNSDERREKYGRRAKRILRHCVFAITTNDQKFLNDVTGNRRYLILHCKGKQSKPVKVVRGERLTDDNVVKQIWAEVYARYQELFKGVTDVKQAAEKLLLPDDVTEQAAIVAEQHLNDNGGADSIIEEFINTKIPEPAIWDLLSREQRRQFFVDGSIKIDQADLNYKCRARGGRDVQKAVNAIDVACRGKNVRKISLGEGRELYQFFGTEYRQHICAAEILDECFDKTDKRKSPTRINELLARLEGWSLGKRIARDPAYGFQRNVYWRNTDDDPADDPPDTPPARGYDAFAGEHVAPAAVHPCSAHVSTSATTAVDKTAEPARRGINLNAHGYESVQAKELDDYDDAYLEDTLSFDEDDMPV